MAAEGATQSSADGSGGVEDSTLGCEKLELVLCDDRPLRFVSAVPLPWRL